MNNALSKIIQQCPEFVLFYDREVKLWCGGEARTRTDYGRTTEELRVHFLSFRTWQLQIYCSRYMGKKGR